MDKILRINLQGYLLGKGAIHNALHLLETHKQLNHSVKCECMVEMSSMEVLLMVKGFHEHRYI